MNKNSKNILLKILLGIILLIILIIIFQKVISYKEGLVDNSQDPIDIPTDGKIPDGYYKINDKQMKKVPYGFKVNDTKTGVLPITQAAYWSESYKKEDDNQLLGNINISNQKIDENTKYKYDNYDVKYHDSVDDIQKQKGLYDASFGSIIVFDPCGNKIFLPYTPAQGSFTYYMPGAYIYGASTYVPNYEDSVYLSKTTLMNTTSRF